MKSARLKPPIPPPTIAIFMGHSAAAASVLRRAAPRRTGPPRGAANEVSVGAISFGRDVPGLDQPGPAIRVLLDQPAKLLGGAGGRVHPLGLECGSHFRCPQDLL